MASNRNKRKTQGAEAKLQFQDLLWLLLFFRPRSFSPGAREHLKSCNHWPPPSALRGGSAVQGQGGGALTWSVTARWVNRLWGFPSGAGQGQPPLCFALGHPNWGIKQYQMAATYAGLGDFQTKPTVNLGWLLLAMGLGLTEARCCLLEDLGSWEA